MSQKLFTIETGNKTVHTLHTRFILKKSEDDIGFAIFIRCDLLFVPMVLFKFSVGCLGNFIVFRRRRLHDLYYPSIKSCAW
jgi:hypothetical protein